MATVYEVPLKPGTPQILTITILGTQYQLTVRWSTCPIPTSAECWVIDFADASGNPLLFGVPIVTGCDLLGQFTYLGIGGKLIAQTDNDPTAVPTFTNLGDTGHLYFVVS